MSTNKIWGATVSSWTHIRSKYVRGMSFGIQSRARQGRAADGDTEGYSQGTHMPTDAHKRCINTRQSYPVTSLLMKSALMTWMWKRGFISLATGRTEGAGKPKILHCVTALNPSDLHVCSHILSSHYTSNQVDNRMTTASHNFDNSAANIKIIYYITLQSCTRCRCL